MSENRIEVLAEKLIVNEIPEKVQMYLIVDFITKLLLVVGKDVILIVYNMLLKITYFVAITKRTLAERLARLFRDNIYKLHGLLKSVISNRELQFAVELTKELNKMLEIETKLLMVSHLQINERIE